MNQGHSSILSSPRNEMSGGSSATVGSRVVALLDRLATWSERRRQRLALEALPDHLLSDIGVSRADASHEADKPFWRG